MERMDLDHECYQEAWTTWRLAEDSFTGLHALVDDRQMVHGFVLLCTGSFGGVALLLGASRLRSNGSVSGSSVPWLRLLHAAGRLGGAGTGGRSWKIKTKVSLLVDEEKLEAGLCLMRDTELDLLLERHMCGKTGSKQLAVNAISSSARCWMCGGI